MTNIRSSVPLVFILAIVNSVPAGAEETSADRSSGRAGSQRSYATARRILDAGLDALGSADTLRAAEDVTITESGDSFARNQSVRVDPPWDRTAREETVFLDPKRQRFLADDRNPMFGGKTIVSDGAGFVINPADKTINPVDPAALAAMTWGYLRRVPHVLLAHVRDQRAATLRYLGEAIVEGRNHNVVAFATANGVQVTLWFDAQTHLLTQLEQMVSDPVEGDAVQAITFAGYRDIGGIQIPSARQVSRNGDLIEDIKLTAAQLNTRPPDSAFVAPRGFRVDPPAPPPPTRETKLADGVYLFESDVNSLVVELEDHMMVIEPHMGGRGPKATIAKVKEMFPTKPIRYAVITHHHFDHSAGARSYVANGTSLVTTQANRRFLERMAASTFTIAPDDQSTAQRTPSFTFVEGEQREFTDKTQTVEIMNIGPGAHAQDMLIAYLPKHQIVFQGDLLRMPATGKYAADTIDEVATQFYDSMARLGLKVTRIAGVHGPTTTFSKLRAAVENHRKAK